MAKSLDDITEQIKEAHGENKSAFRDIIAGQDEQIQLQGVQLRTLQSMLGISADALNDAREAAREAARVKGDDGGGDVPDAKAEEAKAGGFFSRMGKAVMNPVGAMGKSMKSMGKGIQGFLQGLANGLMAFANPLVLKGVLIMSISLPIFAAGLAAAFKVFSMIAGEGKALEMITGIIESLGEAIGTILQKVLEGFGNMVKNMGPFITTFFKGIAIVIKALEPILVAVFTAIKDIITDPVLNKTIVTVLKVVETALKELSNVIQKVGDVIIAVVTSISGIIDSVFNGISKLIKTIGDAIIGIIDKIVEGIERLAVLPAGNMLKVAAGLTAMAGALVLFSAGAAIAGAFMPSAETLERIADSVLKFADIEPGNLKAVGDGMTAVGIGLGVFGVGGKLADLLKVEGGGLESVAESVSKFGAIDATNFGMVGDGIKKLGIGLAAFGGGGAVSALGDAFSSWIGGDKDPVEKFQKFAAIGPGLAQAGMGVTALANSFDAFDTDNLEKIGKGLNSFLGATDMAKLKEFSAATEGLVSGQMLAQLQVQANQAAATGRPLIITNVNSSNVSSSQQAMFPGAPAQAGNNEEQITG